MNRVSSVLLLILLCVLGMNRAQADARQRLLDFQQDVKVFSAGFKQWVTDENGMAIQESSGSVVLARPLRFRWVYRSPFEQVIVSDGKTLWFYDADLDQVTVKAVAANLDNSAALVLSATQPIEDTFELKSMPFKDGLEWVQAIPRDPGGNFQRIEIGFKGANLSRMVLRDSFGQTTRLEFSGIRRNPSVSDNEFIFVIPPGVDVLRSSN